MVNQALHSSVFNIWSQVPFQSKQCQERPFSHKDWRLVIAAGTDWMLTLCWALCPEHYTQMAESPQHHQAGRANHVPSHRWGNWGLARWQRAFAQGLLLSMGWGWSLNPDSLTHTRNQIGVNAILPHLVKPFKAQLQHFLLQPCFSRHCYTPAPSKWQQCLLTV